MCHVHARQTPCVQVHSAVYTSHGSARQENGGSDGLLVWRPDEMSLKEANVMRPYSSLVNKAFDMRGMISVDTATPTTATVL